MRAIRYAKLFIRAIQYNNGENATMGHFYCRAYRVFTPCTYDISLCVDRLIFVVILEWLGCVCVWFGKIKVWFQLCFHQILLISQHFLFILSISEKMNDYNEIERFFGVRNITIERQFAMENKDNRCNIGILYKSILVRDSIVGTPFDPISGTRVNSFYFSRIIAITRSNEDRLTEYNGPLMNIIGYNVQSGAHAGGIKVMHFENEKIHLSTLFHQWNFERIPIRFGIFEATLIRSADDGCDDATEDGHRLRLLRK